MFQCGKNIDISTDNIPEEKCNPIKFIFPMLLVLCVFLLCIYTFMLNIEHDKGMQSYIGKRVLVNGISLQITDWEGNSFILSNGVYADVNFVKNNLTIER